MADNASVSSQKRGRLPSGASPNATKKKSKEKGGCLCPICLEKIAEPTKGGQDSIYCEGECDAWLNRRCAGLSISIFNSPQILFFLPTLPTKKV